MKKTLVALALVFSLAALSCPAARTTDSAEGFELASNPADDAAGGSVDHPTR